MSEWTPLMVEDRMVEAASVLKRLPSERVRGYFNTWPHMMVEFADLVGQETPRLRPPVPSPAAISRMEESLEWLLWLQLPGSKIVWLRASGLRWKTICWTVGLSRAAAHDHWLYALCVIAWKLNGRRRFKHTAKRRLIAQTRSTTTISKN